MQLDEVRVRRVHLGNPKTLRWQRPFGMAMTIWDGNDHLGWQGPFTKGKIGMQELLQSVRITNFK